jgi:putative ABC transport system permease protein
MRSWFRQLVAVTAMNLRNLPARLGTSLVAVVGIGGVVAVLVSLLSMGEGFRAALELSGRDDVALILRGGSSDELSSGFGREQVTVIEAARRMRAARLPRPSSTPSSTCRCAAPAPRPTCRSGA